MKKLAIPAILAATVLIAAMFAIMPVEKASTVHTGIINEALTVKTVANTSGTSFDGGGSAVKLQLTCDKDFVVTSFRVTTTHDDATDDFAVSAGGYFNDNKFLPAATTLDPAAGFNISNDLISNIGTNVGVRGGTNLEVNVGQSAGTAVGDSIAAGNAAATVLAPGSAVCTLTGIPAG